MDADGDIDVLMGATGSVHGLQTRVRILQKSPTSHASLFSSVITSVNATNFDDDGNADISFAARSTAGWIFTTGPQQ